MKIMSVWLMVMMLLVGMTCTVGAEDEKMNQVDETFARTRTWLSHQNMTLAGGSSGRDDVETFNQGGILFHGEGIGNPDDRTPAERELGAKRAAVVSAQRSLIEYINGFALVADSNIENQMRKYDVIRSSANGFVRGTQVVFQEYNSETDRAIAVIKLGMYGPNGFAAAVYEKLLGNAELKKSLTEVDGKQAPIYESKVAALPEQFDGLIVDATEQHFRPAFINRIFTAQGELLYDPSKVNLKILIEKSSGEYTDTMEKARAALAARGVKNPLLVKAVNSMNATDLQISDEDAVMVYSANQKTGFLKSAKVAFIVK
jgi:hypothetical protein